MSPIPTPHGFMCLTATAAGVSNFLTKASVASASLISLSPLKKRTIASSYSAVCSKTLIINDCLYDSSNESFLNRVNTS